MIAYPAQTYFARCWNLRSFRLKLSASAARYQKKNSDLGKTPGAITLTRTFVSLNVVASMRLRWVKAAFDEAYAGWPIDEPFMAPEMELTLTIDEE